MPSELERLYDEHATALFAFLLNFTRDESDTRHVLQEIFVKLTRQPDLLANRFTTSAPRARLCCTPSAGMNRRRKQSDDEGQARNFR